MYERRPDSVMSVFFLVTWHEPVVKSMCGHAGSSRHIATQDSKSTLSEHVSTSLGSVAEPENPDGHKDGGASEEALEGGCKLSNVMYPLSKRRK